jgi:diacylglycerol kinase (ATP)
MHAQAILGPGARQSHLGRLRSSGLSIHTAQQFACEANTELMIVVGGDGTLHRFLPELILCGRPVLVVPCGSGNDVAHALGIRSVDCALKLASDFSRGNPVTTKMDVGLIADSSGKETPFCCTAGVGLDAAAAQLANRMPRWLRGHGGYLIAALGGVFLNPRMKLEIRLSDDCGARNIEGTACLFTIANLPSFGGGLPIAPSARFDDAEFDCVLADAMSRLRLGRAAVSLLRATHLQLPEVHFMRTPTVHVESDPPGRVYADGEFVCETPFEVRVVPEALCVCSATR